MNTIPPLHHVGFDLDCRRSGIRLVWSLPERRSAEQLAESGNLYFTGYGPRHRPGTNWSGFGGGSLGCSTTAVGTLRAGSRRRMRSELISNIESSAPLANPGKTIIPRDRNNFGPAVGFCLASPLVRVKAGRRAWWLSNHV